MRLPVFVAALGFIAGTALQVTQRQLGSPLGYVGALGLCALVLILVFARFRLFAGIQSESIATDSVANAVRSRDRPVRTGRMGRAAVARHAIAAVVVIASAGLAWGWAGWRASERLAERVPADLEGQSWWVTGRVVGLPQAGEWGQRFVFEVERIEAPDAPGPVAHAVPGTHAGDAAMPPRQRWLVSWYGGLGGLRMDDASVSADGAWGDLSWQALPPAVRAGERWQLALRPKAPHGARNPKGFDFELWLWGQGIGGTATVRAGPRDPSPRRLAAATAWSWDGVRQATRERILAQLAPPELRGDAAAAPSGGVAGVVAALVMGDQAAIDRGDWDLFRVTGVAHLMSISGLHITLFAWLAQALILSGWRRSVRLCTWLPAPTAAAWGGLACAAAYATFSGLGVPAQRTIGMLALAIGVRTLGLVWPAPVLWVVVAAVVLALDPWALLQAGFWLSFVAVAVLFAHGPDTAPRGGLEGVASAPQTPTARLRALARRLAHHGRALAHEQGRVTLALAPLTLLLFGQVSVVGLLANLVAIPWVTLVVTPLAFLGCLATPLLHGAAWAIELLMAVLQPMAAWPWATLSLPSAPMALAALGLAGAWIASVDLPRPWRVAAAALALPMLAWQPARPPHGAFELLAADIGQGHAVLVRTAAHALVYDTGPRYSRESDAGHRMLVPLLRALGVQVDRVVVSHRDIDHSGGAAAVLGAHPAADLLSSAPHEVAPSVDRPRATCMAGQAWEWDGVRFQILHPNASAYGASPPWRPNAMSCVLRIEAASGVAALLTGDIEASQELALVASASPLRADWLLVPHHGSRTSSTAPFIAAVAPRIAVVQAGYRNRFGHPVGDVTDRYTAAGARLVENIHCGAAQWSSTAPQHLRCERDDERHYWQHDAPPRTRP